MRGRHTGAALAALVACLYALQPGFAQEIEDQQEAELPEPVEEAIEAAVEDAVDDEGPVDEIIVVAPRPGARRDVPVEFEDPERARLLRELYRSREDRAEFERLARIADEQDGRVRLGYNPDLERPPGLDEQIQTPQRETTQPATIFTIQF